MATEEFRIFALFKATPTLRDIYPDLDKLTTYTNWVFTQAPYNSFATSLTGTFQAAAAPSLGWSHSPDGKLASSSGYLGRREPDEYIVSYRFNDAARVQEFIDLVRKALTVQPAADIRNVGADVGVIGADLLDHWCPGVARAGMFRDRAAARQTINADALTAKGLKGDRVNVVIIDDGLNKAALGTNWGDGLDWTRPDGVKVYSGRAERTSHGMMVARSILDLAPKARLFDLPLLPERIANVGTFIGTTASTSSAVAAYDALSTCITGWQGSGFGGPWVLVNAWAIFDRSTDIGGNYTENNAFQSTGRDHPFIAVVRNAVTASKFDVVFAAGNCGVFCPRTRCGGRDRGNLNSIWGANAADDVITTGAVRTDEKWIGYSSQGPGPSTYLAHEKPDLCAPSNFCEARDASILNSGTSASCAITAGVVAALRSSPNCTQAAVPPDRMKAALIDGARKTQGAAWNERLGNGILDAAGAMAHLPI